jgi:hypothetical protein
MRNLVVRSCDLQGKGSLATALFHPSNVPLKYTIQRTYLCILICFLLVCNGSVCNRVCETVNLIPYSTAVHMFHITAASHWCDVLQSVINTIRALRLCFIQ